MPKVAEVAIGAAAIGASFAVPGTGMVMGIAWQTISKGLLAMGSSFALGGAASLIAGSPQGGTATATKNPIGPWSYVYGTTKVGGYTIFEETNSSQGTSSDKECHRVFVLAKQKSKALLQLRIDNQAVLFTPVGAGYLSQSPTQTEINVVSISRVGGLATVVLANPLPNQDGLSLWFRDVDDNTFNGVFIVTQPNPADATTYNFACGGPDTTTAGGYVTTTYADYKNKIYYEVMLGDQTTSTFPGLLQSNAGWQPSDLCLGCTVVYVRMGYDSATFPAGMPNISFLLQGKADILDPRTGTRDYTENAALCIADYMSLAPSIGGFGLAIGTNIPTAQLTAAANVCDELVPLAGGGSIARYTCNTTFTLASERGSNLSTLLSSCAGRFSYQGGQYCIIPGAWVGSTLTLTEADLCGPVQLKPRLSIRDAANVVKGTYVSSANNYEMGDFPYYAQDPKHGYSSDVWLAEDNNERLPLDVQYPATNHPAIAQRLAKIDLLRKRWQNRLTIRCNMRAYQCTALDVVQVSWPRYSWVNKYFEVLRAQLICEKTKDDSQNDANALSVELDLAETDTSVYDWNTVEELAPQGYQYPSNVGVRICPPPEDVVLYSGSGATIAGVTYPSTITTGADGRVQNSLYVSWLPPNDAYVALGGYLEVQYQQNGAPAWTAWGKFDPSVVGCFVSPVSDGQAYNVRIRAVNCSGVPSPWITAGPETISGAYSVFSYSGVVIAPAGTLSAWSLPDGTALIQIGNFTASTYGAACVPTPNQINGLNQSQLYYVYYIDPTFAGGAIAPIATQNVGDFEGRAGYFLIGSIVTQSYTARYAPSTYAVVGSSSVVNAAAAYDNNVTTYAIVMGSWWSAVTGSGGPSAPVYTVYTAGGVCVWSGFPPGAITAAATLHVVASVTGPTGVPLWHAVITPSIGGTALTPVTITSSAGSTDYTFAIPSGTDLSTVSLKIEASIGAGPPPGGGTVSVNLFETYIQEEGVL